MNTNEIIPVEKGNPVSKRDHLAEMREHLRAYLEAEQDMLTTNPMCCEQDMENYSDSCKWLSLPILGEYPEMVSNMILSNLESFPNECLAGILLEVLKNQTQNSDILMDSMLIDRVGSAFSFCISGSISLKDLRNLCVRYQWNKFPKDEK
jgi:hypothetical protein